jgi:hypothetical protein
MAAISLALGVLALPMRIALASPVTPPLRVSIILSPVVSGTPAHVPDAVLLLPVVLLVREPAQATRKVKGQRAGMIL